MQKTLMTTLSFVAVCSETLATENSTNTVGLALENFPESIVSQFVKSASNIMPTEVFKRVSFQDNARGIVRRFKEGG